MKKNSNDEAFNGSVVTRGHVAAKSNETSKTPKWMKEVSTQDKRPDINLSNNHFMGQAVINGTIVHAMLDTCGAKSMIDKRTALAIGLEIEVASSKKHFGSFYGPQG